MFLWLPTACFILMKVKVLLVALFPVSQKQFGYTTVYFGYTTATVFKIYFVKKWIGQFNIKTAMAFKYDVKST